MIHPYYQTPYFYKMQRSGELWTIVQYLVTSAVVSGIDYALFVLCYNVFNTGLFEATAVAYVGGLITSYILNRYWVFKKNAHGQQFATSVFRYGSLLFVNFLITYGMLWAMQEWFGLSLLIGKFVVWTFLIFWNYFMEKVWVFRGPRQIKKTLSL